MYLPLTDFHLDQPEKGMGSSHLCHLYLLECFWLCAQLCGQICVHVCMYCVCVFVHVLTGNTHSASLMAGPGNRELQQLGYQVWKLLTWTQMAKQPSQSFHHVWKTSGRYEVTKSKYLNLINGRMNVIGADNYWEGYLWNFFLPLWHWPSLL